ncbi:transmembrane protein, putative [Medicago truncatula]|uniref:Transmembrane protein, putative n=1 Tax=Medicago truncatula TaxID=3880 RepID=G7IY08_MEDTR|nr:transmembrane protein, putative [Medicago truncatula]
MGKELGKECLHLCQHKNYSFVCLKLQLKLEIGVGFVATFVAVRVGREGWDVGGVVEEEAEAMVKRRRVTMEEEWWRCRLLCCWGRQNSATVVLLLFMGFGFFRIIMED